MRDHLAANSAERGRETSQATAAENWLRIFQWNTEGNTIRIFDGKDEECMCVWGGVEGIVSYSHAEGDVDCH